jgi:sporulation protein YlmC with PRC-barrel domain
MNLIRDVLDKQLVDNRGTKFGKVDGLIVDWSGNGQPRVAGLELGGIVLARRLGRLAERVWKSAAAWVGGPDAAASSFIPWDVVKDIGVDIDVAVGGGTEEFTGWRFRLGRALSRKRKTGHG